MVALIETPFPECPLWLAHMLRLLRVDTREVKGAGVNAEIRALYETLGVNPAAVDDDGAPWCGVCTGACLARAGLSYPVRFRAARSYQALGEHTASRLGAIVTLSRVDPKAPTVPHGHVGMDLVDAENARVVLNWCKRPMPRNIDQPGLIWLACGNSHNQVDVSGYEPARLLDRRWPAADSLTRAGLDANGLRRAA